jgi:hypothetical protein
MRTFNALFHTILSAKAAKPKPAGGGTGKPTSTPAGGSKKK